VFPNHALPTFSLQTPDISDFKPPCPETVNTSGLDVNADSHSCRNLTLNSAKLLAQAVVVAGCVPQGQPDRADLQDLSIVGVQQIHRVVEVVEEALVPLNPLPRALNPHPRPRPPNCFSFPDTSRAPPPLSLSLASFAHSLPFHRTDCTAEGELCQAAGAKCAACARPPKDPEECPCGDCAHQCRVPQQLHILQDKTRQGGSREL
jgi:hypothetical protein